MAVVAITNTPQAVTIPPGTPVTVSAAIQIGLTSAGASTGPSMSGSFNWPGVFNNVGGVTLWVMTATTANLNYPS